MKSISLFLTLLLFSALSLDAQITFKTEYFGTSRYRMVDGDKDEKVGDSKGSSVVYQGGINIPFSFRLNENNRPFAWGIGLSGAYASLKNKNFTEDLVLDEILNMGVSFYHLRPLNHKWSLMAMLGAGVYTADTRFSKMRFKNVLGSGGVIFICHLKPNLELGGGLAVNNSFGYPMVFPAIYLKWATQGKFNVNVSMLEGLEIKGGYTLNKNITLNLVAEMNGQMALLEKEGKDKIFTHQYIVTGFRPEFKLGRHISIPLTAGIHAMRTAEFSDRELKSLFSDKGYYFQISPYMSAGLNIHF